MDRGRKAALSVSVVCFLVVMSVSAHWNNRRDAVTAIPSIRRVKPGGEEQAIIHHQDININIVSKRRVPNGPDPIHNRREGVTQLPRT